MGLLTGGLSFRRFKIYTPLPEGFRDLFLENITRYAFQENLQHRSKEPLFGWTSIVNPDDIHFDLNKVLYDRYLVLGLRVDKKAINGKLFQILLERRAQAVMAERGLERLGKKHKEEIKEALEEELLGQTLPSVNTYDLAWDIHTGEVLVFATSDTVIEVFQGLFQDTFGARLYAERLVDWLAPQYFPWDELQTRLGAAPAPREGSTPKPEFNADGFHESNPLKGRELELGSEFLSWLWHESELREGNFTLDPLPSQRSKPSTPEDVQTARTSARSIVERDAFVSDEEVDYDWRQGEAEARAAALEQDSDEPRTRKGSMDDERFTLWMDNKLVLKDLEELEDPEITTMIGPAPSASPEAKATFSSGKRPVEARLGLAKGDAEWFFSLRVIPGGLDLAGMKLPIEVKEGDEEKIYERMFLLDVLTSAVRGLFAQFFRIRTSDEWARVLQRWVEDAQGTDEDDA